MATKEPGMVSLRRPKGKDGTEPAMSAVHSEYGYGTEIRLENFELDALKMELPKVGEEFTIKARVKVTRVVESSSTENKGDRNVALQITKMAIDGS